MTEIRFADSTSESVKTVSDKDPLPTLARNIASKDRDSFESFVPGALWDLVLGAGDIVQADGNTAGASYLVISKDPLTENTVTTLTSRSSYKMPLDAALGLSRSLACLGVEFATEVVDDAVLPAMADLVATSVQQTTTTLTVTTATAHGLQVGRRISISGCSDSRLNYPALIVATVPTATTFTATQAPSGTIPSLSAGPVAGVVSDRQALGRASNGTSMIFENATATNASFYVRGDSGDVLPSGTIAGNHSVTTGSNASVALVTAANAYAWSPTTEYTLALQADRWQWTDDGVDATAQKSSRAGRRQVVPKFDKTYKLRFRATNNRSMCRPVARIVSISKAGSTTWTVVTDEPHGLTTSDFINIYGNRDTSNFPNLTTATAVASVVDANTFTVVSTTGTAVGYGGTVYRINGGVLPSTNGAISMVGQSISRTGNIVALVMSASVTGVAIGDYINLHGCRDNVSGADLGLDGPYRIRDIATTTITMEPIGGGPTGADIGSVNCSGTVIKRSDLRISYARVFDYERLRVEALPRPSGDSASAVPVVIQNASIQVGVASAGIGVVGTAAHDAAIAGNPNRIGARARTSHYTAVANDDVADLVATLVGALTMKPYAIPEQGWGASLALTSATAVPIQTAAGAGLKRHITAGQAINTGGGAIDLIILDGATERWRLPLPPNVPVDISFPTELPTTANTALQANLSGAGTVRFNAQGYTAP